MKEYKVFKSQYLIIEDAKGKHQPIYKEFEKGVVPMQPTEKITCPFLNTVKRKIKRVPKKKQYYCETCCMRYESYQMHIQKDHTTCECEQLDEFVSSFKSAVAIDGCDSPSAGLNSTYDLK